MRTSIAARSRAAARAARLRRVRARDADRSGARAAPRSPRCASCARATAISICSARTTHARVRGAARPRSARDDRHVRDRARRRAGSCRRRCAPPRRRARRAAADVDVREEHVVAGVARRPTPSPSIRLRRRRASRRARPRARVPVDVDEHLRLARDRTLPSLREERRLRAVVNARVAEESRRSGSRPCWRRRSSAPCTRRRLVHCELPLGCVTSSCVVAHRGCTVEPAVRRRVMSIAPSPSPERRVVDPAERRVGCPSRRTRR